MLHVSKHPLVQHKITQLRDQNTSPQAFRDLVHQLSQLILVEASEKLNTKRIEVTTPLTICTGFRLTDRIGIIPILRAGLGMAEAMLNFLPDASIWHLGLYRDHVTHEPVWYYDKLPKHPCIDLAMIVDPMLATGGSVIAAIDRLKSWGIERIQVMSLIAAPEGVEAIQKQHPEVEIYLTALDSHLNENKYIVPGLGDAGDRQFGTG